jgi:uncharacterized membrane protein
MKTVIGVFDNRELADETIIRLNKMGYKAQDISVMLKNGLDKIEERKIGTKGGNTAKGAATGALSGGIIGGLTGLSVGAGLITIPGFGAILIAGPLAAALGLAGAAATAVSGIATGILAGGIAGTLIGLGIPEEVAHIYERRVKEGAIFVAVPIKEPDESRVLQTFRRYDAEELRIVG